MKHKNFYISIIALLFLFAAGCEKPHPHPELLDPIYSDMLKMEDEYKKAAESEKKNLEEFELALKNVVPQTGQIKYAQKRYYESLARYERMKQMELYWGVRAKSRKRSDSIEYIKAFNKKEVWPNPDEYKEYKSFKDAQKPIRPWKLEDRMAELGIDPKVKKSDPQKK